ncbi:MAG TPA: hypothetical protein VOA41_20575 [Candidatus Dormibacteraeota bacterium]|nr:hypothetical protein [Candidatus Dormibacteraeota bacterium]
MTPSWSPQGEQIAFAVGTFFFRPGNPGQLALIKPDGSGFRRITTGDTDSGFPGWSPDGKRLVDRAEGKQGRGLAILLLRMERLRSSPLVRNTTTSPFGHRAATASPSPAIATAISIFTR